MPRVRFKRWAEKIFSLALIPCVLLGVSYAVQPNGLSAVSSSVYNLPLLLLRMEMGDPSHWEGLSLSGILALREMPILYNGTMQSKTTWSDEWQLRPVGDEEQEGSILRESLTESEKRQVRDNGVAARTLFPSSSEGYFLYDGVYINNASDHALDAVSLTTAPTAMLQEGQPQVLLLHTHGSEAYTMPSGEEYEMTDAYRTTDANCNMLRIGEEIGAVLSEAGISVIHDRNLYDYPNYSGAYNRSLASVEKYLAKYPSISYILDIHRDAVEDTEGNPYKLLCAEDSSCAQIEFVMGSSGGGQEHPHWQSNLKLAAMVQRKLQANYPTLSRPIILRNSRYNQQMSRGALLVEIGTAGNSLDEALCAARKFAAGFAATILENSTL